MEWSEDMGMAISEYLDIERRIYFMSQSDNPQNQGMRAFLQHPIIAPLIVSLVTVIFVGVATLVVAYISFGIKMEEFSNKLDKLDGINERMVAVETRLGMLDASDLPGNVNGGSNSEEHNSLGYGAHLLSFVVPSLSTQTVITDSWSEINDFENSNSTTSSMRVQNPVAYNRNTQEEYTLDQLIDQKVLLYYTSNGEDVLFYGQFDDEGYYTGDCTTNIYENGNLKLITSANYSRGEILDFMKVFPTTTKAGVDVWAISDRIVEQEHSSGETWYFIRNSAYHQTFELNSVTADDIISAQNFLENMDSALEGYYCGNTSNGQFNDETGDACLIKYFEDGTIRTLYVGQVKNGDFEDNTGNAWMIGKKDIYQANYSYYKGPFSGGLSSTNSKYWINSVSQEWIDEYLQDMTFNCVLRWS